jgi:anti-sigma factor RsiW
MVDAMTTDSWTDRLSEYADGTLAADEKAALDAHLETCDDCRQTLREIAAVAAQLRADEPDRAPADGWSRLSRRLTSVRPPAPIRAPRSRWSIAIRAVAAGVVFAATLGIGMVLGAAANEGTLSSSVLPFFKNRPVVRPLPAIAPAADSFVERSVEALDSAIAEARRAVAADTRDVRLRNYLRALETIRNSRQ